jgi:hypothetical protein
MRIMSGVLSALTAVPPVREEIYKRQINDRMVDPFMKLVERTDGK